MGGGEGGVDASQCSLRAREEEMTKEGGGAEGVGGGERKRGAGKEGGWGWEGRRRWVGGKEGGGQGRRGGRERIECEGDLKESSR